MFHTLPAIGSTFRTGEVAPVKGVYQYVRHTTPTNCVPTSEERQIILNKGERFPPHRSCSRGVIWKLYRIL
jgi:hypothetical protein